MEQLSFDFDTPEESHLSEEEKLLQCDPATLGQRYRDAVGVPLRVGRYRSADGSMDKQSVAKAILNPTEERTALLIEEQSEDRDLRKKGHQLA